MTRLGRAATLFLCIGQLDCRDTEDHRSGLSDSEVPLGSDALAISIPSGVYRYCSATNGPYWAAIINSTDASPCTTALNALGSGAVVQRAGLWSGSGNNVVLRCTTGIFNYKGTFSGPLAIADASSAAAGKDSCVFNIAPESLPIFRKPWATTTTIGTFRGVDLVRNAGTPSGGCVATSTRLDHRAHIVSATHDNHAGYDWWDQAAQDSSHNSLWSVVAAAQGVVWEVRNLSVAAATFGQACATPGPTCQTEVFVRHYVGASTSPTHESFLTYYAHLDSVGVSVGDNINEGDHIGQVGDTGSDHDHIHFGVIRLTNTSTAYRVLASDFLFNPNGSFRTDTSMFGIIDPFGWHDDCFDYAGALADRGALSINLWKSGLAPPEWNHANPDGVWETH